MEKLIKYRQIVQQMLLEYGKRKPARGDIEVETILDTERARYQIFYVGWDKQTRVHHCSIHIDIKGGKIWLQWNASEDDDDIAILNHSQTPVGVVPPCLPRPPGQPSVGLPLPNLSAYFTTHLGLLYC
jgi:hypothetical protein